MPRSHGRRLSRQPPNRRNYLASLPYKYNSFLCRLCKRPHPLRTCKKFLAMNMDDRIRAVRIHKYCPNCLAHEHSEGTCFSKLGCRHCQKFHHTLLHINQRLLRQASPSSSISLSPQPSGTRRAPKIDTPMPSSLSKSSSLTAILRQNSMILLPTVLVKIETTTSHARCLLDSGSPVSRISKRLVERLDLTTLTLNDETICPIVLKSRFDSNAKIEGTFRVDNRISTKTPSQSLPESFKRNFKDMFLADSKFYESAPIDIVLGVDVYSKVICEGVFSKTGLPTAQSTIFGWTIYGSCAM